MISKPKNIFILGPISPEKISKVIASHSSQTNIGAHSIFLGQIRADEIKNKEVTAIEYTAYVGMALEEAQRIREEVFEKYSLTCMHIYHSLGKVKTGSICVFIFTAARNRKAAIEACSELIERIKNELPIWGKEIVANNAFSWKINNV